MDEPPQTGLVDDRSFSRLIQGLMTILFDQKRINWGDYYPGMDIPLYRCLFTG